MPYKKPNQKIHKRNSQANGNHLKESSLKREFPCNRDIEIKNKDNQYCSKDCYQKAHKRVL